MSAAFHFFKRCFKIMECAPANKNVRFKYHASIDLKGSTLHSKSSFQTVVRIGMGEGMGA